MTQSAPVLGLPRRMWTPTTRVLLGLVILAACLTGWRYIRGLAAVTNLDQHHPWGLWIAIDVASGVALAAGGFTTAALVHIFHRRHFAVIARPALLTALLGYTFVCLGLLLDLGRYYNIWHPLLPSMWQGNSVLFEVAMCVVCYLFVLYAEFLPVVCERFERSLTRPRLAGMCRVLHRMLDKTLFLFVIAGVVLSCLHQSSLGNLMVIAPSKMHPLWYTPILPLLFLLSAVAVGFPMVIVESLCTARSFGRPPETQVLADLARYLPVLLGVYLAARIADLVIRDAYVHLRADWATTVFLIEMIGGVLLPLCLMLSRTIRLRPAGLLTAALLVVLGVVMNRYNVFVFAYRPPFAAQTYHPSFAEIAVTLGMVSGLILVYRAALLHLPLLPHDSNADAGRQPHAVGS